MKDPDTAVVMQSGRWRIGWNEEVPGVNCREASEAALLKTPKVPLREALVFNRREALT